MGKQVVVLRPHRLKGCVLSYIGSSPWQRVWINSPDSLTNLSANDRDSTETAVETISFKQTAFLLGCGHPDLNALVTQKDRRGIWNESQSNIWAVPAPE
jgi:hypothetical protein